MTPRRRLLALAALVLLAVIVGACGDGGATGSLDASATPDVGAPSLTAEPPETAPPGSDEPSTEPGESAEPTDAPSDPPATETPTGSPDSAAAACTGTDANREFFTSVAGSVDWAVYCPVLPEGWFVEGGQYRLAGGGWLEITYEGPDGGGFDLRQGAPCEADGCVPSGTDLGAADYGDLAGTLLDLGNGRLAVVVDAGQNPSWTLIASDLSADEVRAIAADLALVEG